MGRGDSAAFRLALGCSVLSGFRHESEFTSQGPLCLGNGLFDVFSATLLFSHASSVEDCAVLDESREVGGVDEPS